MKVLLAEDNDGDAELLKLALEEANISIELDRVTNGEECMQYLRGISPFEGQTAPDLLILDINMPVKNGIEVMRELWEDKNLRTQPVIVLSTSDSASDIKAMYDCGCNAFARKPSGFSEFVDLIQKIMDHWSVVILPNRPR